MIVLEASFIGTKKLRLKSCLRCVAGAKGPKDAQGLVI